MEIATIISLSVCVLANAAILTIVIKMGDGYKEMDKAMSEIREIETLNLRRAAAETKKIKAFEIIKEKDVDAGWLKRAKDLHEYNSGMGINSHSALSQEEFELLKEELL